LRAFRRVGSRTGGCTNCSCLGRQDWAAHAKGQYSVSRDCFENLTVTAYLHALSHPYKRCTGVEVVDSLSKAWCLQHAIVVPPWRVCYPDWGVEQECFKTSTCGRKGTNCPRRQADVPMECAAPATLLGVCMWVDTAVGVGTMRSHLRHRTVGASCGRAGLLQKCRLVGV